MSYKDAETLREMYHGERMEMSAIADEFGVAYGTIQYWMDKHDIERRDNSEAQRKRHAENERPYKNEDTLRREYIENGRTTYELADAWGCDQKTITNWLRRFGIETRKTGEWQRQEHVTLWHTEQGYVYWKDHTPPSRGDSFPVHRLLAIAEYGMDAVKGNHVHHENGVKWDNRPENLEIADPSEHAKLHYEQGDLKIEPINSGNSAELRNEVDQ